MKKLRFVSVLCLSLVFVTGNLRAQVFDFKSWHGTYPEMGGDYPLTFIAFKGKIIPIPHVFIRTWPTHYYMEVVAEPTYDTGDYINELKVNFLKIAARVLEKSQMKQRQEETEQIKNNTEMQRDIGKKIFDAQGLPIARCVWNCCRLCQAVHQHKHPGQAGQLQMAEADLSAGSR